MTTFRGTLGTTSRTDEHGRVLHDNVFGSQAEDAARRDFTANALYYDPTTEAVVDYHHGVADLKKDVARDRRPRKRYRKTRCMLRGGPPGRQARADHRPGGAQAHPRNGGTARKRAAARLFDEMLKLLFSGYSVNASPSCAKRLHHGLSAAARRHPGTALGEKVRHAVAGQHRRLAARASRHRRDFFATLLCTRCWPSGKRKTAGEPSIPALFQAPWTTVLDSQAEKARHHARIAGRHQGNLALQPRSKAAGRRARTAVLEQPRFRAAYDFLAVAG